MSFSNCPRDILTNANLLPMELLDIIYSYIPERVLIFLTKKQYLQKHHTIKNYINKKNIENYIRTTIRQDNHFVFGQMLIENWYKWINMKQCYYKHCIYSNYLIFLEEYCLENESIKCRNVISELFEKQGLSKNKHKKKVVKYIKWKN
jgi:hypothetical protein